MEGGGVWFDRTYLRVVESVQLKAEKKEDKCESMVYSFQRPVSFSFIFAFCTGRRDK